jgi:hypothetical protein
MSRQYKSTLELSQSTLLMRSENQGCRLHACKSDSLKVPLLEIVEILALIWFSYGRQE